MDFIHREDNNLERGGGGGQQKEEDGGLGPEHGYEGLAPTVKQTGDAATFNNSPYRSECVHEAPDTGIKQDVQLFDVRVVPGSSSGDTEKG